MTSAEDLAEGTAELLTLCHQMIETVSEGCVFAALNAKSGMPELEVQSNPLSLTGNQYSRLLEQVERFNFHGQKLLRNLRLGEAETRRLVLWDLVASGDQIVELFYRKADEENLDRFQEKLNFFCKRIQQKASELGLWDSGTNSTQLTPKVARKENSPNRAVLRVVDAKQVASTSLAKKKQKPLNARETLLMKAVDSKRKGGQWPRLLDSLGVKPPAAWECKTYAEAYKDSDLRRKLQQEKANFIRRHCKK